MRHQLIPPLLLLLAQLFATGAFAQSTPKIIYDENFFSVFVGGVTPVKETSLTSFTVGADYELRLTPRWGAAALVIATLGDHPRTGQIALGATYRPTPKLRLSLGPGTEVVEVPDANGGTKRKFFGLMNAGAQYALEHRGITISPVLFIDFFGRTDTNLTYGIAIGGGF